MTGTLHTFNNILDELNEWYEYEFYEIAPNTFRRYDLQTNQYDLGEFDLDMIVDFYVYEYTNKYGISPNQDILDTIKKLNDIEV